MSAASDRRWPARRTCPGCRRSALPGHRVDFEPGIRGQRALHEAVLEPGRALEDEQPPLAAGGAHQHCACVVFDHGFRIIGWNLGRIDRRVQRVGRHRKDFFDRRAVGGRNQPSRVEDATVREHTQLKRPATVAGAHRRHVKIDGGLIQPGISGRDAEHLPVVRAVRRADPHGENRWATGPGQPPALPASPAPPAPVSPPSDNDHACDALASISFTHSTE